MAHRHGRCRRGQRLRAGIAFGHWKTTTFTAGLRRTGMVAPWALDGPMNADAFLTYVTRVLVPELSPGDVIIMDSLSSRKAPAIRTAIESIGATLLFLPL
jgi:transposase